MLLHPCADKNKTAPVCLHTRAVRWVGAGGLREPGCFCAVFCDVAAAVRIRPLSPEKVSTKQKIQHPVRMLDLLVGAGGFEQPVHYIYRATGLRFLRFSGFIGPLVAL